MSNYLQKIAFFKSPFLPDSKIYTASFIRFIKFVKNNPGAPRIFFGQKTGALNSDEKWGQDSSLLWLEEWNNTITENYMILHPTTVAYLPGNPDDLP